MTPYTDEQRADLAKRIDARAKLLADEATRDHEVYIEYNTLWGLVEEIRDGTFFELPPPPETGQ